jgi:hypothetical protein
MSASPSIQSPWGSPGYQAPERAPRSAFINYLFGISVLVDRFRPDRRGVTTYAPEQPLFPFTWRG